MIKIGRRWEFWPKPGELPKFETAEEFAFTSLRVETFLKYGGPLVEFLKAAKAANEVIYFSDYLPVPSTHSWDAVHQYSFRDFVLREKPALISAYRPLTEVPPPASVVRDLLEQLPKGVEAALFVRNRDELNRVRDLNGVFVSINASDWQNEPGELSHFADRILEVQVDVGTDAATCARMLGAINIARTDANRAFYVTIVVEHFEEQMKLARALKKELRV